MRILAATFVKGIRLLLALINWTKLIYIWSSQKFLGYSKRCQRKISSTAWRWYIESDLKLFMVLGFLRPWFTPTKPSALPIFSCHPLVVIQAQFWMSPVIWYNNFRLLSYKSHAQLCTISCIAPGGAQCRLDDIGRGTLVQCCRGWYCWPVQHEWVQPALVTPFRPTECYAKQQYYTSRGSVECLIYFILALCIHKLLYKQHIRNAIEGYIWNTYNIYVEARFP